ncbi:sulfite exporter TauE/SafE family protein [Tenacibaculum sp. UWU-22]|uniref:urease accessory protein UreH domain-containing protein n=1 Tax=Tenacibaculum sp. UWU-22 TaxID=3234187 RepID=UPI0034DAC9A8
MFTTYPLIAGLLAASLHVISGPDHLAAVTPFVIDTKKNVWKIGLFWGFGHLLGMLLIGVLFLLFKDMIPVDRISKYSEQMVAFVLLAIGFLTFYRIFNDKKPHAHPHVHTESETYAHIHKHNHHNVKEPHQHNHTKVLKNNNVSALVIGIIHGLAGVAHFLLLLPVLGYQTTSKSVLYIVGFALGTVFAMMFYTLVLGKITNYSKQHYNNIFFKGIRIAGGLFALVIGFYWLYLSL